MKLGEVIKKYGIPPDAIGTCGVQSLRKKHISYVNESQYIPDITPDAGAYLLIRQELYSEVVNIPGNLYIPVENPMAAFLEIHNSFHRDVKSLTTGNYEPKKGRACSIDSTVKFGDNVVLGDRVFLHPNVVIGSSVSIGDDTEVMTGAVIYDRVHIGKRNIIDANASVGGDGYRIMRDETGNIHRLIHIGGVEFGDDVEFGNSSCVDRGTFGNTVLENRVKVDNLVHIGHNAHIKENSQLAASSCIGGSTVIGRNCWVGIGATLSNGLVISDNASILINAVVVRNVPAGETVSGFYSMPRDAWRRYVRDRAQRFDNQAVSAKQEE